MGSFVQPD
jgi:transcription termination factor Rho